MSTEKFISAIELPLFSILRISPFPPQKFILEQLLKKVLSDSIQDGSLEFLREKILKIAITDAGISWQLSYANNKLMVLPPKANQVPDATISGNAKSFVLLASLQEDPDTLFFQRKLSIEGNTELGLEVKNLLDSVELDLLPTIFQRILSNLGKLAAQA